MKSLYVALAALVVVLGLVGCMTPQQSVQSFPGVDVVKTSQGYEFKASGDIAVLSLTISGEVPKEAFKAPSGALMLHKSSTTARRSSPWQRSEGSSEAERSS